MLLRRISKHVTDQNWFAVFIDFLIVVVGVFIGIQIGNWNDSRLDYQSYIQAHDRMIQEAKDNIKITEYTLERTLPYINKFKKAIDDIRSCRDDEASAKRINDAMNMLTLTLENEIQNSAITQMTTSERLLAQQSQKHRLQYLEYATYIKSRIEWSVSTSSKMEARSDELHPYLDYGSHQTDGMPWEKKRTIILSVEPKVACQDDSFRKLLYRWENGHNYQIDLMNRIITKTEEFLKNHTNTFKMENRP